jgi:hypothetical protein
MPYVSCQTTACLRTRLEGIGTKLALLWVTLACLCPGPTDVVSKFKLQHFAPGDVVVRQGDPGVQQSHVQGQFGYPGGGRYVQCLVMCQCHGSPKASVWLKHDHAGCAPLSGNVMYVIGTGCLEVRLYRFVLLLVKLRGLCCQQR